MIHGNGAVLDPAAQRELAVWAVKTAWAFQSMSPDTSTATAEQRQALAATLTVPAGVQVRLGYFLESGDTVLCTSLYLAGSSTTADGPINTSVTTLVIGRVVLQVIQQPAPDDSGRHAAPPARGDVLHPLLSGSGQPMDWASARPVPAPDLDTIITPVDFSSRTWDPLPGLRV
jgi:hypothetical protein